ncbi:MAG: insulinase family protein, partial [Alistipes sp.]|nr:insulinase family protein [Alistipes sp.]
MKRFILLVVALASLMRAAAQPNPMEPIPADKAVRVGRLANGMTYYLRHNEKPKEQASFYILHNVGAIQENDAQQGLAHFLEHMAFNGTENLPGKTMIEALERNGVKFGADVNAFTMHDITCYNLTNVPTINPGVVDTALLVLHDWSQSISLLPEEIDNERGVIMEELRTRDGAMFRGMTARNKALNKGSKYEERNVIGYLEGLKSFSYDEIRDFYKTWYRPEYQAIIIVGDIDVDAIESKIKELMSDIPASPADAPQKEFYPVPANEEPIVSIFADPENSGSVVRLFIKRPAVPFQQNNLVIRQMFDILDTYVSLMESMRINEIARQPEAPFLGGAMQIGDLIGMNPTQDLVMWAVQTRDGELLNGYKALVTEMEKMRRYGFTQGEFERAQAELLRQTETIYANRNDRTNEEYTNIYLMAYRKNMPMPDAETEYKMTTELLQLISLNDVNAWAQNLVLPQNQVITIDVPLKEGLAVPTEAEVLAIRAEAMAAEVEAYEDNVSDEPLIPAKTKLKGSPVKKTVFNEEMGAIEWTLKNGTRIVVKPTQFKADEVLVRIKSDGGTALLPDDQVFAAEMLPSIVSMSGIANFSATDLNKKLAGKNVGLGMSIDNYTNGMQGSCSPKDMETLLQLIYLSFTNPRFTQEDFNTTINTYKSYLQNLTSNPDYLMAIESTKAIYGDNPRRQEATMEMMDGISF